MTSRSTATAAATSSAVWPVRSSRSATATPFSRRAATRRRRPSGVSRTSDRRASVGSVARATRPCSSSWRTAPETVGCEERSSVGQRGHALRAELVEQGQDPDAGRVPDPAAYGAHQPRGVHDELAALLLEVGRHLAQDTETVDGPTRVGTAGWQRVPTYIAFLRAINVGKRMFAKGAIVQACEDAGCTDVETYINTGNVRRHHEPAEPGEGGGSAGEGVRGGGGVRGADHRLHAEGADRGGGRRRRAGRRATAGCSTSRCSRTPRPRPR